MTNAGQYMVIYAYLMYYYVGEKKTYVHTRGTNTLYLYTYIYACKCILYMYL